MCRILYQYHINNNIQNDSIILNNTGTGAVDSVISVGHHLYKLKDNTDDV